ncbi:glycosyltransferase family 4 protein [Geobacillus zalihae]|uniref:glycosyltransferase family 4 protein n=1 Tax=Geobacillus zalihae TaxID=213419 RepID=UPI000B207FC2|nr:glycosyltransferase family 1 protein [Geobacillus zalihae]
MVMVRKKRIYINARFLTQSITGVQRFAIELVKALDNLIDKKIIDKNKIEIILLAPKDLKIEIELKHIFLRQVGFLKGHLWEQFELPIYSRKGFLINLCNTAPLLKRNQTVAIHDAAVFAIPEAYTFIFRTWYKVLYKCLGNWLDKIITVSNFSKNELVKFCGINPDKIHVIYEGKEHILSVKAESGILEKYNLKKGKYLLAVSSLNPNKNFIAIIKALEMLGNTKFDIAIAGGTDPKVFNSSNKLSYQNVKYLGYVSDEELKALYENAACFIFPSFYEGFGLPPLEAMACGCPVIISNTASLPEIFGDVALLCDPYKPETISRAIKQIELNPNLRKFMSEKGIKHSQKFQWEKCALELLNSVV